MKVTLAALTAMSSRKAPVFALVLLVLISKANALKCGTPLTTDCVKDSDIRYDPDYTNDLLKQAPVWEKRTGFERLVDTTRDGNGTGFYAVPYDETTGMYGTGPLTNLVGALSFENYTIIGSRTYKHIYVFTAPVPQEFCQGGPPEGTVDVNVGGEQQPICGVNGRLIVGDSWGASTYEKDGSVQLFKGLGWWNAITSASIIPIDERTVYIVARDTKEGKDDAKVQFSGDVIYYGDNFEKVAVSSSLYQFDAENPFKSNTVSDGVSLEEEQWLEEIQEAMDKFNIPASKRVTLPMTTECLHPLECASEEDFCTVGKDPECSVSPYQEPAASLNGGGIALIVILCVAAVVAVGSFVYRRASASQKKRYKEHIIRGIARNITIAPTAGMLSPELLQKEFGHIDKDKGGTISKVELKEFLDSGKVGDLSVKDFDAMWAILDLDGSGEVDFVEFTVFLSSCGEEFEQVHKETLVMTKKEKLLFASKRLSVKDLAAADDEESA